MKSIRTINMVWEQRFRGTYPVSRNALDSHATLALAIPRPLEARAYDLMRLSPDGSATTGGGFAAETLVKLEIAADAASAIGMTVGDIYLFRGKEKCRFLGERHVTFIDCAQSDNGCRVATVFSDIAGASFTAAYGDFDGRVQWTYGSDQPLSAVAISGDGQRVVIGTDLGTIRLLDSNRQVVWEFSQDESIRSLACSNDGATVVFGAANGVVGAIDADGGRAWRADLSGEVILVAISGDGSLSGVLSGRGGRAGANRLTCLVNGGQIGWEFESERQLLGLALSPDGGAIATGARDGTVTLYRVVAGEATIAQVSGLQERGAPLESSTDDPARAYREARAALDAYPSDADLCETVALRRTEWIDSVMEQVSALRAQGDARAAASALDVLLQAEPGEIEARKVLADLNMQRAQQLLADARLCEQSNDAAAAEAALREAIALQPLWPDPRRQMAALNARRAADLDAEANRFLATGDLEAAVAALERAQAASPTPDRAVKRTRAQIAQEFDVGMTHYNAKRYREAVFQFKKVLVRDPDHGEAKRYMGYAQRFLQDNNDTLTDRFSRLE